MGKPVICEHGRRLAYCKECGGSQICEHGRQRTRCMECGGGSICEHGKLRYRCKECRSRDAAERATSSRKGQKRSLHKASPKRGTKRKRRMWPCGAPPGVPVTADGAGGSAGGTGGEAPRKLTRFEAMWTDCDPALWEYVLV